MAAIHCCRMAEPVVVTRPLRQAIEFANRLEAAGRAAVVFPLLQIAPLPDATALRAVLGRLSEFSLAAFVSPNAIDATFAHIERWPPEVALAVMGQSSRQALARHGITADKFQITSPTDPRRSDSQTLLEALDLQRLQSAKVLILRGETGRELLGDALRAAGAQVEQVAAYRRSATTSTPALMAQLAGLLDTDNCWVITSSEALQVLMQLVAEADPQHGVAKIQQKKLLVPHERIREVAQSIGFSAVELTDAGDDGLFGKLQSAP